MIQSELVGVNILWVSNLLPDMNSNYFWNAILKYHFPYTESIPLVLLHWAFADILYMEDISLSHHLSLCYDHH